MLHPCITHVSKQKWTLSPCINRYTSEQIDRVPPQLGWIDTAPMTSSRNRQNPHALRDLLRLLGTDFFYIDSISYAPSSPHMLHAFSIVTTILYQSDQNSPLVRLHEPPWDCDGRVLHPSSAYCWMSLQAENKFHGSKVRKSTR